MARPRKILPSHDVHIMLPEDIYMRMQLHLFSEAERCIPRGKLQAFFIERLNEYFSSRASRSFSPSLSQEIYLGLETIFSVASKKDADPREAVTAIARWSRIYADRLLEGDQK